MRAVDSNVLVRLLMRDDERQVRAAAASIESGAWASHLALAETAWVLQSVYDIPAHEVATAIEMLLNHRTLVIEDAPVVAAALEHFKGKPSLGFADCLMLELARRAGHLPLATFDKALAKLPGAELIGG